jgi:hypothetical protein
MSFWRFLLKSRFGMWRKRPCVHRAGVDPKVEHVLDIAIQNTNHLSN